MSINVYIPTPFRHLVGNRSSVKAQGGTVSEVLGDLDVHGDLRLACLVSSQRARGVGDLGLGAALAVAFDLGRGGELERDLLLDLAG